MTEFPLRLGLVYYFVAEDKPSRWKLRVIEKFLAEYRGPRWTIDPKWVTEKSFSLIVTIVKRIFTFPKASGRKVSMKRWQSTFFSSWSEKIHLKNEWWISVFLLLFSTMVNAVRRQTSNGPSSLTGIAHVSAITSDWSCWNNSTGNVVVSFNEWIPSNRGIVSM